MCVSVVVVVPLVIERLFVTLKYSNYASNLLQVLKQFLLLSLKIFDPEQEARQTELSVKIKLSWGNLKSEESGGQVATQPLWLRLLKVKSKLLVKAVSQEALQTLSLEFKFTTLVPTHCKTQ